MQTNYDRDALNKYGNKLQHFESLGGYTYKREIETIFTKFGFRVNQLEKRISEFSGGQRTKLTFIKLLLSKSDIITYPTDRTVIKFFCNNATFS